MTDRIAEIRREIEQGTYETAERVDGAVERIVEIMRIPPTYDRVARMSNTELFRQLELTPPPPRGTSPTRVSIASIIWTEIQLRCEGMKAKNSRKAS